MRVMAIVTYPVKRAKEVGKIFVEKEKAAKRPDYVKRGEIYTRYGDKGIIVTSVSEIEKGHEEEGIKYLVEYYVDFYEVEGFEVQLPLVLTAEESLPLIGF